jgi:predicted ArsR family transcriptional regulator
MIEVIEIKPKDNANRHDILNRLQEKESPDGASVKEVANELDFSSNEVKDHITNEMQKVLREGRLNARDTDTVRLEKITV